MASVRMGDHRFAYCLRGVVGHMCSSDVVLDAIRSELRDLNEKAGKAADVTPPQ